MGSQKTFQAAGEQQSHELCVCTLRLSVAKEFILLGKILMLPKLDDPKPLLGGKFNSGDPSWLGGKVMGT